MNTKVYTLALLQAFAEFGDAIRLSDPVGDLTLDGPTHTTGGLNVAGDLHVTGDLHIHGDANIGGNHPGGNDNQGGSTTNCDQYYTDAMRETIDMQALLRSWFSNQPENECYTSDLIEWLFSQPGHQCVATKNEMANTLEREGLNFKQLGDQVEQQRPWMKESTQQAFFKQWDTCFPTFQDDKRKLTDDEVNADYIRSLVPVGQNDPNDHNPADSTVCSDGATDPALMMQSSSIEDVLYHWFFQATIESEPVDWDCVLMYIFENMGSQCVDIRDTTADILKSAGVNWGQLPANISIVRSWMHQGPIDAYFSHFARCFPTFTGDFDKLEEKDWGTYDSDYIRTLQPEAHWD